MAGVEERELERGEEEISSTEALGVPGVHRVWRTFKAMITPHPLGGCSMGTSAANGVVDHKGEVFGYRNLFVSDGAIVPRAIGYNPSKTIAALGERIAEHIVNERR